MLDIFRDRSQSLMIKVVFGLIILAFVFLGVGNFRSGSGGSAAVVNGEKITLQQFWGEYTQRIDSLQQSNPQVLNDPKALDAIKAEVLNSMIGKKLLMQAATKLGFFVTPHEILEQIKTFTTFQNDKGQFDPQLFRSFQASNPKAIAQLEENTHNMLLENKLIRTLVQTVVVTDEEVRNFFDFALENRTAEYVLFAKDDYMDSIKVTDKQIATYYDTYKQAYQVPEKINLEYILLTPETLAKTYSVSDEEIAAYYKENEAKFFQKEQHNIRHIFVEAPKDDSTESGTAEKIEQAKERIKTAQERLARNEPFENVARDLSQHELTAEKGGEIGWLERGALGVTILDDTAFSLNPGEISTPIRTEYGFHIIQLIDKKPAGAQPLEYVKDKIIAELKEQKAIADEARVREVANKKLLAGESFEQISKELNVGVNETGLVEKTTIPPKLALQPDAIKLLDALPVNATAPSPLNVSNGIMLAKLLEVKPSYIPALEEVKDKVINELKNDGAVKAAREAASAALSKFTGTELPGEFADKAQKTSSFVRLSSTISPFGTVPEMSADLSGLGLGVWASKVYDVPEGTVIVRVVEAVKPAEEIWQAQKGTLYEVQMRTKRQEAMRAFITNFTEHSKIVQNWDVVQSLTAQ